METLEGMAALVTGSSRGIGRATALALASKGANVAVNYRTREDAAAGVVREIVAMGRRAISVGADIGNPEECGSLVEKTLDAFGRLDILINNAGVWRPSVVENVEPHILERLIATNVKGAFYLAGPAVRFMKEARWGRIVNVSSVIGVTGFPGDTMYSATKAALLGFTSSSGSTSP
jgi:3-oxoacyl-[acyl-carrier protein] reductase